MTWSLYLSSRSLVSGANYQQNDLEDEEMLLAAEMREDTEEYPENPHKGTIEGLYELKSYASTTRIPFSGQSLTRLSLLPSQIFRDHS